MFLFSDSQIKLEAFVEDLNTLLNTGEVPNLFPYDERAALTEAVRPAAVKAGCSADSPSDLWNFFVDRTKANLHIVLTFSPIGDAFRYSMNTCSWLSLLVVGAISACSPFSRLASFLHALTFRCDQFGHRLGRLIFSLMGELFDLCHWVQPKESCKPWRGNPCWGY